MDMPEEVDLSKLPAALRYTRNANTGNTIAEDAKAGFNAARAGLIKKGAIQGLTPTENAIVTQGAGIGDKAPINMRTDVPEPRPSVGRINMPAIAAPVAVPPVSKPVASSVAIGDIAPGSGYVEVNGKRILVGRNPNPVITQSAEPAKGVVKNGNQYQDAALASLQTSNDLLSRPAGRTIAENGTIISEGANAVGANIVARGQLNRAKTLAAIGNTQDQTAIAQQNADTGSYGVNSQVQDRLRTGDREDAIGAVNVAGKKIENEAAGRINSLQAAYHAETDPAKRDAIQAELTALTGKTAEKYQQIVSKDEFDTPTYIGSFDTRTGNMRPAGSTIAQAKAPASAIAFLKANPHQKAAFKAKYGYLPPGFV